jgi:hypothetical protein
LTPNLTDVRLTAYLAPTSECELNIDHNIRGELVAYMTKIVADVSSREGASAVIRGTLDPAMAAKTLHASQLQTMVKLYERIQGYIFRLMATDSVPKVSSEIQMCGILRTKLTQACLLCSSARRQR